MDRAVALPVTLPGLHPVRGTTDSLHVGVKEHHGVGRIDRGDTRWWGGGKEWHATPGCILVKQPGDVVRHLSHVGQTTFTAVRFSPRDVERVHAEGKAVPIPQLAPDDERAAPFHRLLDAVQARADRFTLEVALAEAVSALATISTARPDHSRPVRRAMAYIHDRLADPFTLDELADFAGLDKFHLCRAFRAQIGMPPHAYLIHLRIARAKQLLLGGTRASDVAPLVGIYDQAQLTRHFRRLVGTTPARFGKHPDDVEHRGVLKRSAR
ncbi:MAG TPA: AraC family transcriptional regulator [Kofleriaceae bacterium]|jgi:AraC-like DNA-binding protein|nr:AraC family transcriptional regulator [Kofleriaceae bacterium]